MLSMLKRIPARVAIALGQTALVASVLLTSIALGLVPSERGAAVQGRAALCEAIAVASSVCVTRQDPAGLRATLDGIAGRNADILSLGVRTAAGKLAVEVGEHRRNWSAHDASAAVDSHVYVPIYAANQKWGTVEVRFRPLGRGGVLGFLTQPSVRLVLFVSCACAVLFAFYLRKMLKHLDPSKVVPKRVRSALDTLAEGLLVVDNDSRVVLANQVFAAAVGETQDALLGREAAQFAWALPDGADAGTFDFPWVRCARERAPQTNQMLRLTDAAGARRAFSVNCSPVLGQDGQYRGVLSSFDDVTRLEAQEVEVRRSRDAAEAANRAKSEFLARMSHEIRTPMNAILGFADILRRGFEHDEAERREYLNTIHSSGRHLLELINDILDLSKIESGKMEVEQRDCPPHELIRDVVAVLRVRAEEKGVALEYAWDAGGLPARVTTDPTRLRQALTNLVGNAIKFTDKGSVRLVAGVREVGGSARLFVDVTDTGIGIKPDALARIFKPFAQADTSVTRRFGGTGLGLAISRQLAEALGGDLTVQSEFGRGSTFTLTINPGPLAGAALLTAMPEESADRDAVAAPAVVVRRLPRARVLLAEDGISNQKLVTLILRRAGVEVDVADNGQIAIDKAMGGGHDLVLMDMQMPLVDGYTATRTLRASGFARPIIALTAHAMLGEKEKCLAAGCSGFLTKPIDMDLLLSTLADELAKRPGTAAAEQEQPAPAAIPAAAPAIAAPRPAAPPAIGGPIESTLPTDDADFCEIVVEFVERLHAQLAEIRAAWGARELARVAALAHWLKGSGGTAGFADFTRPAALLEQAARDGRMSDVQAGVDELVALASRVVAPAAARPQAAAPKAA
jgi:PAS domain S-box-containing protein